MNLTEGGKIKAIYIGSGFVGTCSAAHSAESGHNILVYDVNEKKIQDLKSLDFDLINRWVNEIGLFETLVRYRKRIRFSSDKEDVKQAILSGTQIAFFCLPTPTKNKKTGASDLSYIFSALDMLKESLSHKNRKQRFLIVLRSTLPLDAVELVKKYLEDNQIKNTGILCQPEFLVEGSAMADLKKNRIIIGADNEEDSKIVEDFFSRHWRRLKITRTREALAIKLLSNAALFCRLAFTFSTVGATCEGYHDLRYEIVREGVIADERIGPWGFYVSLFAGGSCFIKDALNLAHQLRISGLPEQANFLEAILEANDNQAKRFIERMSRDLQEELAEKKIGLLGLAFKQDTNDCRNSGALHVLKAAVEGGAKEIIAHDPFYITEESLKGFYTEMFGKSATQQLSKYFSDGKIKIINQIEEALENKDIIAICTDHQEYKALAKKIQERSPKSIIWDGRRMLQESYSTLMGEGHPIIPVGSPTLLPASHPLAKEKGISSSTKGYAITYEEDDKGNKQVKLNPK